MEKMANFMAKAIVAGVLFDAGCTFSDRMRHLFESVDKVRNARDKFEKTMVEKVTGETIPDKTSVKAKNKIGFSIE